MVEVVKARRDGWFECAEKFDLKYEAEDFSRVSLAQFSVRVC